MGPGIARSLEWFFVLTIRIMWWLFNIFLQLLGIGLGAARNRMSQGGVYQPPRLVLEPEDEPAILKAAKKETPIPVWLVGVLTLAGCTLSVALNSTGGCILGLVVLVGGMFGFFYLNNAVTDEPVPTRRAVDPVAVPAYRLTLPDDVKFEPDRAVQLMSQLSQLFNTVMFQIVAEPGQIYWQILDWDGLLEPDEMQRTLRRLYPELEVSLTAREAPDVPVYRYGQYYTHGLFYPAPIAEASDVADHDPLVTIVQAMSELEPGDRVIYTLVMASPAYGAGQVGEGLVTVSNVQPIEYANIWSAAGAEMRRASRADQGPAFVDRLQRVLANKLNSRLYQCMLSVDVEAQNPQRVQSLALAVLPAVQFEKPEFNGLIPASEPTLQAHKIADSGSYLATDAVGRFTTWATSDEAGWAERLLILSEAEMAALWHLPHEEFGSDEIVWVKGRQVPVPSTIAGQQEGVVLGDGKVRGGSQPVYCTPFARTSHMLTIGRTRYGKSTFLHNLIHQDIGNGAGVAVLDPHGDLVRDILANSIPQEREDDVVVWDLANQDVPPPLNLFAVPPGLDPATVTQLVAGVFEHAYSGFSGTRMAETLQGVLLTLARDPEATPRDARRLFSDTAYREQLNTDPVDAVGEFWQEWDNFSARDQQARMDPIRWRMRQFYTSDLLRPVFCNSVALDLGQLMREGKILLFSLRPPEGKVLTEQNQRMLGAMIIALLQMHVMSGANNQPYYLYIDEAQNFTTSALAEVLNEAGKRQLYLTLSHQTLGQLDNEKLRTAVLGNIGALVAFSVGEDATALAKSMAPSFSAQDLRNLPPYQAAVRLKHPQEQPPAFTLHTRPQPGTNQGQARVDELKHQSNQRLGLLTREKVEDRYRQRYSQAAEEDAIDQPDAGDEAR